MELHISNPDGSYDDLRGISGVDLYAMRDLCNTREEDRAVVPKGTEDVVVPLLGHLRGCGLNPVTEESIIYGDWRTAVTKAMLLGCKPVPFLFNRELADALVRAGFPQIEANRRVHSTAFWDDKANVIRFCRQQGIPTPVTILPEEFFASGSTVFKDGPKLAKLARDASGMRSRKVNSMGELESWRWGTQDRPFILQEVFPIVEEASVQLYIEESGPQFRKQTGQYVLNGVHEGNFVRPRLFRFPVQLKSMRRAAMHIARAMHQSGFRGWASVDYLIAACGTWAVTEVNPRGTGARPPTIVAERLGAKAWSARNYVTAFRGSFEEFLKEAHSVVYNHVLGEGWIFFNPAALGEATPKFGAMLIAPPERWPYWFAELDAFRQPTVLAA